MPTPTKERLRSLREQQAKAERKAEGFLLELRSAGVTDMDAAQATRWRAMQSDVAEIREIADHYESEVQRANLDDNEYVQRIRARAGTGGPLNTGALVSPLAWPEEELRRMHGSIQRGESCHIRAERRDFNTVDALLPAQLYPLPIGPIYEPRLLDRLPAQAIDAPSMEYIQHNSTTGSPGVVAEGQPKPELIFNVDKVVATAQKLAAHSAVSTEIAADWPTFASYVQAELRRQVINVENDELINGDATTGHLRGFLHTSGVLTHDCSADPAGSTPLDSVEISIAELRVGQALAEPDILVLNPVTWSSIRRTKDQQDRYLATDDPAVGEVSSLWGVSVLPTTQIAAGKGLLVDSTKFGRVLVREVIAMRVGWSGTDFTDNLVRFVVEERLALAVERPPAVLSISGLPTS